MIEKTNPQRLLDIDVSSKVEKKGTGNRVLSYLSWAWAWAYAITEDPNATYKVELFEEYGADGRRRTVPYMSIYDTAMVMVTVTMFGKPITCQLPVMDHKNQAISEPDAFAVNTAIMRCLAKGLGLHGLGLALYAGEDLIDITSSTKGKIISPRGDIGEDLPDDIKESLRELAAHVTELVNQERPKEAYFALENQNLEDEQKTWLWDKLDSRVRSALKKSKETK